MTTIVLDLDDGSVVRTRWDLLLKLKDHYPKLKVSLFWIPFDYETEMSLLRIQRDEKVKLAQDNLDWVELIPHGLAHIPREFEKATTQIMTDYINNVSEIFEKDGLSFKRGFKAPYWLWNKEVVDVLDINGWFGATDRNQPDMVKPKKNYIYTHSIDEPFWNDKRDFYGLHGHMTPPSNNDLESCFLNLMKMPHDAEFKFVSEVISA